MTAPHTVTDLAALEALYGPPSRNAVLKVRRDLLWPAAKLPLRASQS